MTKDEFYFYTTLATIVISLSALGLSIWNGYLSRKHNRLLVNPYLLGRVRLHENQFKYEIVNDHLGPAVINKIRYFANGININENDFSELMAKFFKEYNYIEQGAVIGLLSENSILASGTRFIFIKSSFPKDIDLDELYYQFTQKFKFTITYSCIYNIKRDFESDKDRL